MTLEQIRKELHTMRYQYAMLQGKAMENGDEMLAAQNAGAYLAIDLVMSNLGLNDHWNTDVDVLNEELH